MSVTSRIRKVDAGPVELFVSEQSGLIATEEVFERLCEDNADLRLSRMPDGEVIVGPPAGSETSASNFNLTVQLGIWNREARLGVGFDSSGGFTFPNGLVHSPDASWIINERWAALTPAQQAKFDPIVPDFVAELGSPSDRPSRIRKIMKMYIDQGVRLGWFLDQVTAEVEIYRPGKPVEVLKRPATLSSEDVLPGFVLDLKGILFD